jgi:hypothetical protein
MILNLMVEFNEPIIEIRAIFIWAQTQEKNI